MPYQLFRIDYNQQQQQKRFCVVPYRDTNLDELSDIQFIKAEREESILHLAWHPSIDPKLFERLQTSEYEAKRESIIERPQLMQEEEKKGVASQDRAHVDDSTIRKVSEDE